MLAASPIDRGPLRLIGGGGHALVVAEAARGAGFWLDGFYDDQPLPAVAPLCAYRGGLNDACRSSDEAPKIIAVGDLALRRNLATRYAGPLATVIHPAAIVSPSAKIGPGSFLGAGAVVNGGATIGPHAIINTRAVVEHDCVVDTNVHVGPGGVLGGAVHVGSHSLVGINACVKPGIRIGCCCVVGVGAVVVHSVVEHAVVVGCPARPLASRPRAREHRRVA